MREFSSGRGKDIEPCKTVDVNDYLFQEGPCPSHVTILKGFPVLPVDCITQDQIQYCHSSKLATVTCRKPDIKYEHDFDKSNNLFINFQF